MTGNARAPERRKFPVSLRESPKLNIDSYFWRLDDKTKPKIWNKIMSKKIFLFMVKVNDQSGKRFETGKWQLANVRTLLCYKKVIPQENPCIFLVSGS